MNAQFAGVTRIKTQGSSQKLKVRKGHEKFGLTLLNPSVRRKPLRLLLWPSLSQPLSLGADLFFFIPPEAFPAIILSL